MFCRLLLKNGEISFAYFCEKHLRAIADKTVDLDGTCPVTVTNNVALRDIQIVTVLEC